MPAVDRPNANRWNAARSRQNELKTFYASETVSLAHIISRVAALFDLTGQSAPLAVLGNYIARLALPESGGDKHKQVTQARETSS